MHLTAAEFTDFMTKTPSTCIIICFINTRFKADISSLFHSLAQVQLYIDQKSQRIFLR